jgi:hypothetical protein
LLTRREQRGPHQKADVFLHVGLGRATTQNYLRCR